MNTSCIKCGNTMQLKKETLICDMTGMKYNSSFGKCDCAPGKKLPKSIQDKLDALDELEKTCNALGLHDKISAARHALDVEINAFLDRKSEKIRLGQFN